MVVLTQFKWLSEYLLLNVENTYCLCSTEPIEKIDILIVEGMPDGKAFIRLIKEVVDYFNFLDDKVYRLHPTHDYDQYITLNEYTEDGDNSASVVFIVGLLHHKFETDKLW